MSEKNNDRVSLNALSSNNLDKNKVKNHQKDIKPENVAALREALLSVMGESETKNVESVEKKESANNESVESKALDSKTDDKNLHTGSLSPDDLKRILDINQ